MNTSETLIVLILFFIVSIFSIALGYIIKKHNMADIISGFDSSRDDPKIVCKITGDNLMLMGAMLLLMTVIYFFTRHILSLKVLVFTNLAIIVLLCINIYYRWNKYLKDNKK